MPRFAIITSTVCASLLILACGLTSVPVPAVQNLLSTAQAVATTIPSTADAAATSIPETLQAVATSIPSGVPGIPSFPDVGAYLNPTGTPATEWNGIPIMPQALSGQEFNKGTYAYKLPLMAQAEIESFYDQKLSSAGWKSEFTASTGAHGGILVFNKDSQVLTVTVTTQDQDLLVLLILE
jgi:hypothetical protein